MAAKTLNVDGVRRLLNVSPEAMSDDDIRRMLVHWSCERDPNESPAEAAEGLRRFAEAMNRPVQH